MHACTGGIAPGAQPIPSRRKLRDSTLLLTSRRAIFQQTRPIQHADRHLDPPLQGFRAVKGIFQPIKAVKGRLPSRVMGLHLEADGELLRLWNTATQRWLPIPPEVQQSLEAAAAAATTAGGVYKPKALTQHEFDTLKNLCEIIVPGAAKGSAAEFIDLLSSQNPEMAMIYTGGIAWLDELERYPYLAYLDAKGFRYYIPAFLLSLFQDAQGASMRVITTFSSLRPTRDLWLHHMHHYELLNGAQRASFPQPADSAAAADATAKAATMQVLETSFTIPQSADSSITKATILRAACGTRACPATESAISSPVRRSRCA